MLFTQHCETDSATSLDADTGRRQLSGSVSVGWQETDSQSRQLSPLHDSRPVEIYGSTASVLYGYWHSVDEGSYCDICRRTCCPVGSSF